MDDHPFELNTIVYYRTAVLPYYRTAVPSESVQTKCHQVLFVQPFEEMSST